MTTTNVPKQSTNWLIIILTLLTALIHFSRAAADPEIRFFRELVVNHLTKHIGQLWLIG